MPKTIVLSTLIALRGTAMLLAQTTETAQLGQAHPKNGLSTEYHRLNRQIFTRSEDPGSGELPDGPAAKTNQGKLRDIVRQAVAEVLTFKTVTSADLRKAIDDVQGDHGSSSWGSASNMPFADISSRNGSGVLVVAYLILQGGEAVPDSRNYVDFYTQVLGSWQLKATQESDFNASTFFMSRLVTGIVGEDWYIAWGRRIGDTGVRLNIRIYGFNGEAIRTVWRRDGLIHGNIQIMDGAVTLDYDERYAPTERVKRIYEFLHVTVNGLQ